MKITVLTDASYCPQYKVAGYGFWIACARGKLGGSGQIIEEVEDTNSAEMMAICNSIWAGTHRGMIEQGDSLLIQTDSLAAIDRLSAHRVVNVTAQQHKILDYYNSVVKDLKLEIIFRHVKAHTSHKEARFAANRLCDKNAKAAMKKARFAKIGLSRINQILEILNEADAS